MKRWLALAVLLFLAPPPTLAFDDAAFCQRLTDFAAKANEDRGRSIDGLSSNEGVVVSCDAKTLIFQKAGALSSSKLSPTWHARMQKEWNAIYCGNQAWTQILANGWKVSTTFTTFDGRRVTFRVECK